MKKLAGLFFGLSLAALTAAPAQAANPVFGQGFGVNIKTERITDRELDLIAALKIERVRIGITWYWVEFNKGSYQWDIPQPRHPYALDYKTRKYGSYDQVIAAIRARNLSIDATLMEGKDAYTGPLVNMAAPGEAPQYRHQAPRTPEAIQGFANFAAATASHYNERYGSDAFTWHIWNEPDTDGGFAPKTDPGIVGQLLSEACQAIQAADPQAKVMGPALSAFGDGDLRYEFIDGMFSRANPLNCLNGFTIHPYRAGPPESAPADYARVAMHLAPYQPKDKAPVPVAVDEWGYSNNKHVNGLVPPPQKWRTFSSQEQAALMLRMYLTNLAARVPLTTVYEWRDSGVDPYDWEHHFGIINFDGTAKAGYTMMKTVWPLLSGRELLAQLTAPKCTQHQHFYHFGPRDNDGTWVVAWTETGSKIVYPGVKPNRIISVFGFPVPTPNLGRPVQLTTGPLLMHFPAGVEPNFYCK